MKTIRVNPRELRFSSWNINTVSPENQRKLEESIRRNGIFRPVVARELEDGSLEIIAGEHTTRAAISVALTEIDVYNLGRIDDRKAKEISLIDNQHFGTEDLFQMADLLKEIDDNPSSFMPFSADDLTKIFSSSAIDLDSLDMPEGFDDENLGREETPIDSIAKAPVTHQTMKFRVPVSEADYITRFFAALVKRQGLESRDSTEAAGDALVYIVKNWGAGE